MPWTRCLALLVVFPFIIRPAGAAAPECLSAVDGMIVEYNIPVGQPLPGVPPSGAAAEQKKNARPAPQTARSGRSAVATIDRHPMSEQQRRRLQDTLERARIAEARGEEAQCMDLLRQAQSIAKAGH